MALLPGTIWCEAEFQYDGATLLRGSCGPNALAMALSWAHQSYLSTVSVYRYMRSHNLCEASGASNASEVDATAQALGTVSAFHAYDANWLPYTALNWIDTQLDAGHAVVLNVANGQALVDSVSGKGENARNLQYHFLTLVGRDQTHGYFAVDGDNLSAPWQASTAVRQYYTTALIMQARPCGAIGIARQVSQGAPPMRVPPGWRDNNAALFAPNDLSVTGAMRDYVLAYPPGWDSDDWPLEEQHDTDDGRVVQTFQFNQLRLTKADGKVQRGNLGADFLHMQAQIANDDAAIKTTTGEVIALHKALDAMQATIADLEAKLAATPLTKAQAAIAALSAALAEQVQRGA